MIHNNTPPIPVNKPLTFSNVVLHPLSCTQSKFGALVALITSAVLHIFTLGIIRFFCTDDASSIKPIIAGVIQTADSKTIRPYPGDLTTMEKPQWSTKLNGNFLHLNSTKHPAFNITIRPQDMFESNAQVLVNAANDHLGGGTGIDGAIHQKGGFAYAEAHKDLKRTYGGNDMKPASYPLGHAAMIKSGDLTNIKVDNVIVIAGPQGPSTDAEKEGQLYSCYYNSLLLAASQNKQSIAFPAISTGVFKFPKDRAAAISLRAINNFMDKHPNTSLKTISIHSFQAKGDPKTGLDYYADALK